MYRKDDAPSRSSILLSSKEYNSTEELKIELEFEKSVVKNLLRCSKAATERKQQEENIESLSEARRETKD